MASQQPSRHVVIGVDTHKSAHHVAVIDADTAKLLGDSEFPANAAGYRRLVAWVRTSGELIKAGIEGTGSYGAGLHRYLTAQGIATVEVSRPNRQDRRARGKSDPIDAINAARAVVAETATGTPKDRDGFVEIVRMGRVRWFV